VATQAVVAAASAEDTQRMMNEAEQRWQQNVRSGRVKSVSSRELVDMVGVRALSPLPAPARSPLSVSRRTSTPDSSSDSAAASELLAA
jgi:hypothetical protein